MALAGVSCIVVSVGVATTATAGQPCVADGRDGSYSYAGHQASSRGHGIRAAIALTRAPEVSAGHVAGWVGVGGPGQGARGGDAWIQAGIASLRGLGTVLYAEIKREGQQSELVLADESVAVGRPYRIAVLEVAGRPGWWRISVDGTSVTKPIRMRGTSGRWAPIATAESWNAGTSECNAFGFRFDRVAVAYGARGLWHPFVSGHRFLDGLHTLRDVSAPAADSTAFVAASS